ncbi:MAG: hypothetical protein C0514_07990 [Candidatus Puniceispirillum sp.]|nr:hypothetical protein [Candidatus Puniceispirillum sp.]
MVYTSISLRRALFGVAFLCTQVQASTSQCPFFDTPAPPTSSHPWQDLLDHPDLERPLEEHSLAARARPPMT